MTERTNDIQQRIASIEAKLARHPYYTIEVAEFLRVHGRELTDDARARLTHAVALTASDPSTLYMLIDPEAASHIGFYPSEHKSKPSTRSVIDTFLDTYGSTSPEEDELLNKLIFNPTPDYAQVLAREEQQSVPQLGEAQAGSQDDLINRFILKQKEAEGTVEPAKPSIPAETVLTRVAQPAEKTPDDSLFSESLAKIFIRQHQYERAFEIITQLNLNFPEKSAYFADQLRFLQKLIKIKTKTSK